MNHFDLSRWREIAKALVPVGVGFVVFVVLVIKGEIEQAFAILALLSGTGAGVFGVKNRQP